MRKLENFLKMLLMVATIRSTVALVFTNMIMGIQNLQDIRKKIKIKSNETVQRNVAPNNHLAANQEESPRTFFPFSNLIIAYDK
ncbi:hypothetical protein [Bacillus sp. SRB1LM]|uniref:hypothetical protein n=1 Tax=Bacillus sp. SRB1LM TaxID=2608688 RepID=UPI0018C3B977|nr:hypothetical protein [Bacillus sp. SRB1LM]MBG0964073.1 hypothetical protein [Bacillus sp. SRB1LM]